MLDRFFKLGERGTSLRTEVLAGVTFSPQPLRIAPVFPGLLGGAG